MGLRVQFMKDKAATLEYYAIEGRPSADGDVTVYTSGTSLLDSTNLNGSSNAIRDSVATTTTANAALGAETLTLADVTGIVKNRRYLVTNTGGEVQEVVVLAIDGSNVSFDQPLRFAADSGSAFDGHRLTVSLTTTHTASIRRRMRAMWEYTVDSVSYRKTFFFDVVSLPFELEVEEEDIEIHEPGWGENIGSRRGWTKAVQGARKDIWLALEGMQVYPDLVRDVDVLRTAAVYRVLQKYHRHNESMREYYSELYHEALDRFQASKAWYDSDDDLALDGAGSSVIIGGEEVYSGDSNEIVGGETVDERGLPVSYMRVG